MLLKPPVAVTAISIKPDITQWLEEDHYSAPLEHGVYLETDRAENRP